LSNEGNPSEGKKNGRRKFLKIALGAGAIALLLYFFYPEIENFLKKKTIETVTKTITKETPISTETTAPITTSATPATTTTSIATVTTSPTATTTATTRTMTIPTRAGAVIPLFPETARRPFLEFDPSRAEDYRETKPDGTKVHGFIIPVVNRGNGGATAVLDIYKLLLRPGERTVPFPWILTPDKMFRPREVFYLPAWSSRKIIFEIPSELEFSDTFLGVVLALYDPILDPCGFTLTEDILRNEDTRRHYAYVGK
jgi:hypothetical protein